MHQLQDEVQTALQARGIDEAEQRASLAASETPTPYLYEMTRFGGNTQVDAIIRVAAQRELRFRMEH
jgi:hypothetical protein